MKEVLRTQDLGHAYLLRAALEAAGIDAVVHGDMGATILGGGVMLLVLDDADLPDALAVVSEVEGRGSQ
ncbi:MAG: DUF2007 domain-containing protein [Gemmatimonadales bacterium]|nr:DUF2007 domain-containing protein [Gemmatimonadales bacterium]